MTAADHVVRPVLAAILAAAFALAPSVGAARASASHRAQKDFRELIVKGERPEIAACMVAALNYVRSDATYDSIRWDDDDSETAYLRESDSAGHLLRTIRFSAQVRMRAGSAFFESWRSAQVSCEQRDEESPQVRLSATGS